MEARAGNALDLSQFLSCYLVLLAGAVLADEKCERAARDLNKFMNGT